MQGHLLSSGSTTARTQTCWHYRLCRPSQGPSMMDRQCCRRYLTQPNVLTIRPRPQICRASEEQRPSTQDDSTASKILDKFPFLGQGPGSLVLFLLWAGFVGYALLLSPNYTPSRDTVFIEKLIGLRRDEFAVNTLYTCLFNAMGIYPLIFLALIQPSGKSGNKVPAWPFTTASFGLGFLSLGLYQALWTPSEEIKSPPSKSELNGLKNLSLKGTESTIFAVVVLLIVVGLIGTAGVAAFDSSQWIDYFHLFDESRLDPSKETKSSLKVHVSTLDFFLLTAVAPFWMSNDAQKRGWEARDKFVPALSFLPLFGPALYLLLRPKAD